MAGLEHCNECFFATKHSILKFKRSGTETTEPYWIIPNQSLIFHFWELLNEIEDLDLFQSGLRPGYETDSFGWNWAVDSPGSVGFSMSFSIIEHSILLNQFSDMRFRTFWENIILHASLLILVVSGQHTLYELII